MDVDELDLDVLLAGHPPKIEKKEEDAAGGAAASSSSVKKEAKTEIKTEANDRQLSVDKRIFFFFTISNDFVKSYSNLILF